ncbi:MAG: alpha/beta hydrolase, partial [Candidatus Margulisbacteria bacterium]|nr:alpha/beta hydrolase [Candidatus Margulisiibacteriota bacterium]
MYRILLAGLLLLAQLGAAEYRLLRAQKLEIPAADLTISATYYPVSASQNYAVILIHALGRNRGDWNDLAKYLQKEGIAALTFDLRGHGESIAADQRGWRLFQDAEYQELNANLAAVYAYAVQK